MGRALELGGGTQIFSAHFTSCVLIYSINYFRAYSLFYDESRSVQFLAEYSKEFLFNEETNAEIEEDSEEEEETKKDETSNMETSDT